MSRFYSVVWQDGSFDLTASVLAFDSKKARAAYPLQSTLRVEDINSKKKAAMVREGRLVRLALWDASEPTQFKFGL